jgi:hypothetical protein
MRSTTLLRRVSRLLAQAAAPVFCRRGSPFAGLGRYAELCACSLAGGRTPAVSGTLGSQPRAPCRGLTVLSAVSGPLGSQPRAPYRGLTVLSAVSGTLGSQPRAPYRGLTVLSAVSGPLGSQPGAPYRGLTSTEAPRRHSPLGATALAGTAPCAKGACSIVAPSRRLAPLLGLGPPLGLGSSLRPAPLLGSV